MKELSDDTAGIDFKRLFESAPAPMLVLTTDLYIAGVSEAYLDATMTRRQEIMGKYIFDVFPDNPEDADADGVSNLHASLKRVLKYKKPDTMAVQRYDIRRPEHEGGEFEVRYWSPLNVPVLATEGAITHIIHRVEDVTEFMKLKEQSKLNEGLLRHTEEMEIEIYTRSQELAQARSVLERKNAELMRSNAEMESFSYSVSHDLRAPLRAVSGYAGMLAEDYGEILDAEGKRLLGEVQKNSKKMGELIDDLLALSKLGRKELHKVPVDMRHLIEESLTQLNRDETAKANIRIGELCDAIADPSLLQHVLVNLLSNAIKYSSRAQQPVVDVSSAQKDDEVIYTVRDNGVGFDMAYANKLYGVFQRLHSPADFEGTGVGLAIVKRIVERHGGRVWAEGKLNEGAAFSFSLPCTDENQISA
jgi:signal transduction histidine kinase